MLNFNPAGTPCDATDVVCNELNGHVQMDPKLNELAKQVSNRLNISPYVATASVLAGVFLLKWFFTHKKNPTQTPWESLLTLVGNEFGVFAQPIKDKLNVIQQALNGEFKVEVLAEQPFLNQDGEIFSKMLNSGIESKLKEILPSLVTVLLTPENKTLVTQNAEQATQVVASTGDDAGTSELAQASARENLERVLREMVEKAKTIKVKMCGDVACSNTATHTPDGRLVYVEQSGSMWMNFRDAHKLGRGTTDPAVMVEVDKDYKPITPGLK